MRPLELNYFYANEAEQFHFYRIPKLLFTDHHYKSVSVEAKVLYGLLLDRMSLSLRNGWLDEDGRVFLYFTLEEAIDFLGFGKDKLVKIFKELDGDSGIGLIERKKQGQGKPTKIYVKNFILPPDAPDTSENPKSGPSDNSMTSENPKSRLLTSRSQDVGISDPNYTDKNNTEKSIYPPHPPVPPCTAQNIPAARMEEILQYREAIMENIEYGLLLKENPYDQELIDGYVELMTEACCTRRAQIRVNQEDVPAELVRSRLLRLGKEHIGYVLECLKNNTVPVGNLRAYTLSALYNAPVTMEQHYTMRVSQDLARKNGRSL